MRDKSKKSDPFWFFYFNKRCGMNEYPEEEEKMMIMDSRGENLKL